MPLADFHPPYRFNCLLALPFHLQLPRFEILHEIVDYEFRTVVTLPHHGTFQAIQLFLDAAYCTHHVYKPVFVAIVGTSASHIATASLQTRFANRGELRRIRVETTSAARPRREESPRSIAV